MSREAIEAALLVENGGRCRPPLADDEVQRIAGSVERYRASTSHTSVEARLGALSRHGWIPLPLVALRHREIRLTLAEFEVLVALLGRHFDADVWGSFSQQMLASDLGINRRTLGAQLLSLRRKGFLAVRPDPAHRSSPRTRAQRAPLRYCAEPYLVVLTLLASRNDVGLILKAAAVERLLEFTREVDRGRWIWRAGDLSSLDGDLWRADR
jgi:DNA-binding MarR family transcriptional regulator